jgi:multidrug efflux pump subunit AcrA (membrane-fusion protein)
MVSAELPVLGDIAWQDWEHWLPMALSVATLVAALGAWLLAGRAARRTTRQADATRRQATAFDEQVAIAREALALARQEAQSARADAERQRSEADRSRRLLEEARLDALAPTIVARALPDGSGTPGRPALEACQLTAGGQDRWRPLTAQIQVGRDQTYAFRTALTLWFENVSDRVAQVDIVDSAGGELDLLPGHPLVVPGRESRSVTWMRLWTSQDLDSDARIQDPAAWLFNLTFTVTDLGVHVRDTYAFDGDLRFFDRDGSWLVVMPEPPLPWTSDVASMLPGRAYQRLDAPVS